jgi:Transcription factor Pcc1
MAPEIKYMKVKAQITFQYQTPKQAKVAFKSLLPDNRGFLDSYQDNNYLICNLNGKSIRTILSTADDLLFSEMMVERILELIEVLGLRKEDL